MLIVSLMNSNQSTFFSPLLTNSYLLIPFPTTVGFIIRWLSSSILQANADDSSPLEHVIPFLRSASKRVKGQAAQTLRSQPGKKINVASDRRHVFFGKRCPIYYRDL
jgi:hypothetical protein